MVRRTRIHVAATAVFTIAIGLIAARDINAQSLSNGSDTTRPGASLQEAVRAAVERAGPLVRSQSPAAQTSTDTTWDRVSLLAPGAKVTVHLRDGTSSRGRVVNSTADVLTVGTSSDERSLERTAVRKVTVPNLARRMLFGTLGIVGGAAAGLLVCPYCANEGSPEIATLYAGIGAAAGATMFLISPSRTIYQSADP